MGGCFTELPRTQAYNGGKLWTQNCKHVLPAAHVLNASMLEAAHALMLDQLVRAMPSPLISINCPK